MNWHIVALIEQINNYLGVVQEQRGGPDISYDSDHYVRAEASQNLRQATRLYPH